MRIHHLLAILACASVALLAGGCATGPGPKSSLPGTTTANPQLERDTAAAVLGMDRSEDCTCNQRSIVNREVGSAESRGAVEYWTVDRCGALLRYTVTYSSSPAAGTLIGFGPSPQVVRQAPDRVTLPLPAMLEDVWYRSRDRGPSLVAFSAIGKLVISEQGVAFGQGADALEISFAEVKSVCWGKLPWDTVNEWVVVTYASPEKVVGFKDGSRLGYGTATPSIMSTMSSALKGRPKQQP